MYQINFGLYLHAIKFRYFGLTLSFPKRFLLDTNIQGVIPREIYSTGNLPNWTLTLTRPDFYPTGHF